MRDFEITFRRKDGQSVHTISSYEIVNVRGEEFYLAALLDITDRKKSEQLKDDFIGMVSHELKTPLTIVIGALDTAMSQRVSHEDAMALSKDAVWAAEAMVDIVDNLWNYRELSRTVSNWNPHSWIFKILFHKSSNNRPRSHRITESWQMWSRRWPLSGLIKRKSREYWTI